MEDGDGPLVCLSAMLVQLIVVEGSVCSVVLVCFCLFLVFCKEDREEGFSSDHLAERERERKRGRLCCQLKSQFPVDRNLISCSCSRGNGGGGLKVVIVPGEMIQRYAERRWVKV